MKIVVDSKSNGKTFKDLKIGDVFTSTAKVSYRLKIDYYKYFNLTDNLLFTVGEFPSDEEQVFPVNVELHIKP